MAGFNLPPGVSPDNPNINTPDDDPIIVYVNGLKALFCNVACRDGFRADRVVGVIYPPFDLNGKLIGPEEASILNRTCAYCDTYHE